MPQPDDGRFPRRHIHPAGAAALEKKGVRGKGRVLHMPFQFTIKKSDICRIFILLVF